MVSLKTRKKQLLGMEEAFATGLVPESEKEALIQKIEEIKTQIKEQEAAVLTKKETVKKTPIKPAKPEIKTEPKADEKPKGEEKKRTKLSWRSSIAYEELFGHGRVFELDTVGGCSERVGIVLDQDTEVFVKGNVDVIAKKGEIVEMVKTEEGKYRQFNIIGEPFDKCLRSAELLKTGTRKALKDKHFEAKTKVISTSTDASIPPLDKDGNKRIDTEAIAQLDAYLAKAKTTKELNQVEGKYTKERQLLHRQIIDMFIEKAACIKREQPIAIFMGGLPGSGKTTFIRKKLAWLSSSEIFKIDADEVRAMLPEYEGWNAALTHDEVVDIMKGYEGLQGLFEKVGGKGCSYDLLYDGTMTSSKKHTQLAKHLREAGYKIYTIYLTIPAELSKARALKRYQKSGKAGRYVPSIVLEEGKDAGTKAFEEIKPLVDGWILVDGQTQAILEQGGEALPKDRDYSKLTNVGDAAKGAETKSVETEKTTKKAAHPEHYSSLPMQYKAVADILYMFGEFARIGMATWIVSKVIRRADNRIVLELSSAKRSRKGYLATNDQAKLYFLVQEKSRKLVAATLPTGETVLVDAKAEVLLEGEKSTHNYLDILYGNDTQLKKCWSIQLAVHRCKQGGNCTAEEKKQHAEAAKRCKESIAKGIGKYLAERSSLFDKVFNQQQRGESEIQAINRFAEKEQE